MRKVIPFLFLIFSVVGCKKAIEKMKEDAVISAMTDGQWIITSFINDGDVITTDFKGYKFQYYSNKTVDAIKDGSVEMTGTWEGDPSAMTISANFLNATQPLSLINGTWHIDNNSWTFVVATQTSGTIVKKLRLEKL